MQIALCGLLLRGSSKEIIVHFFNKVTESEQGNLMNNIFFIVKEILDKLDEIDRGRLQSEDDNKGR